MFPNLSMHFHHLLPLLPSLTLTAPLSKRAFSNGPVITSNFPDPTFIDVNSTFYAFATANGLQNIPIATSPDFNTWTLTDQDALPTIPTWSSGATWAPSVMQVGSTFIMYFTAATTQEPSKHCIGIATSSSITGPYNSTSDTPFACPLEQGGAIDPAGFQDSDGTLYVVYKIDGNSLGGGGTCGNGDGTYSTPIMLQKLQVDGITADGDPVPILERGDADGPLIEAPNLIHVGGTYFLFFSSNCFNGPSYDTSYATAGSVAGPYTKASAPLLTSSGDGGNSDNGALFSPGGATVGPSGTQMVFHADHVADDSSLRQMWTAGIAISGTTVAIS